MRAFRIVLDTLLWPVLYLGYVAIYYFFLARTPDPTIFENILLISLLPILLLLLCFVLELLFPYKKDWSKPGIDTVNNLLYIFISDRGEAIGKILALGSIPILQKVLHIPIANIEMWSKLPFMVQVILGVLIYDFVYYWYHRLCHRSKLMWRIHRLHHSSEKLTTLSAFRFNILDIIIELALLTFVISVLGIPERVFLMMIGLMTPATIMSHSNFYSRIPDWIGWLVINPMNHRIHHAKDSTIMNKNFGGYTLLWDAVFGTYQPVGKLQIEHVGVEGHKTSKYIWSQMFDFLK